LNAHYVHELLHAYGPWAVGGVAALEYAGLPLPGETTLIAASLYAATTGRINLWEVVAAAAAGAVVGSAFGYRVGSWLGAPALHRYGRRIGMTPERLLVGRYLFARYGIAVVVLGRFVALIRAVVALVAGANEMPVGRFMVANVVGAVLWASMWGFGAELLGHRIVSLAKPAGIALAVATLGAAALLWVFLRRHERKLLAIARREIVT
jgi:membrane protein DedA with SNARE-associated domain